LCWWLFFQTRAFWFSSALFLAEGIHWWEAFAENGVFCLDFLVDRAVSVYVIALIPFFKKVTWKDQILGLVAPHVESTLYVFFFRGNFWIIGYVPRFTCYVGLTTFSRLLDELWTFLLYMLIAVTILDCCIISWLIGFVCWYLCYKRRIWRDIQIIHYSYFTFSPHTKIAFYLRVPLCTSKLFLYQSRCFFIVHKFQAFCRRNLIPLLVNTCLLSFSFLLYYTFQFRSVQKMGFLQWWNLV